MNNVDEIKDSIIKLKNEKNFYGILSTLELIKISYQEKNNEKSIILYDELLGNKNLDNIYKSAIGSKAAYEFININFQDLNKDYSQAIENFISFIDDQLVNYQGIKLELNYLLKILDAKKNNIKYLSYQEALDLYENIMNSDTASSSLKERIKNIHEFFYYQ